MVDLSLFLPIYDLRRALEPWLRMPSDARRQTCGCGAMFAHWWIVVQGRRESRVRLSRRRFADHGYRGNSSTLAVLWLAYMTNVICAGQLECNIVGLMEL